MKPTRPRILKLRKILSIKPFKGVELEEEDQTGEGYFSLEKLLDVVQSSEEELKEGLKVIGAFCLNGNSVSL